MASDVDAQWYCEGSGVPVGWKERAVGFNVVPFEAAGVSACIAPGAMVVVALLIVLGGVRGGESLFVQVEARAEGMNECLIMCELNCSCRL
jgi:hypothetical protein